MAAGGKMKKKGKEKKEKKRLKNGFFSLILGNLYLFIYT